MKNIVFWYLSPCSWIQILSYFRQTYLFHRGTRWRSRWRYSATNRKVVASIPDGVIGIFHWHNPSGRNMALGLTQSLTEMSKVKRSRYRPGVTQSVGRGIALLFHDRGTRRGWVVSSTPRPHFIAGKDPVPIVQEAGWALGPVWTDGKSRPLRDSIPDRPARSQSLYRLSYRAHQDYFLGSKGGRSVELTILPPVCFEWLEIWEPQPPGTLRACPAL
jgi:hypothetical protein